MKTISISGLKTYLSAEIKTLESDGSIVVCDRGHPVALLSSYGKEKDFSYTVASKKLDIESLKKKCGSGIASKKVAEKAMEFLLEDNNR